MMKVGDYVLVAGRLGVIYRESGAGRTHGWVVQTLTLQPGDGTYPHLVQDWMVHPAVVGVNVCVNPYLTCFCGLTHAPVEQLDFLPVEPRSGMGKTSLP
jgi:hypothetical protein